MNCNRINSRKAFSSVLLSLALAVPAFGDIIPGLFGTGLGVDGSPLADGTSDPHFQLVSSPFGSGYGIGTFVVNAGYPIVPGAWFPNSSISKWIAPAADMAVAAPPGIYVYRTTFDLTGVDPATVILNGRWSTDNAGLDILINGVSSGIANTNGPGNPPVTLSFWQFSTFSITTGFIPGLNTLDFVVENGPPGSPLNPTGLRVELSGTVVPEPTPGSLIIAGMLTLICRKMFGSIA